MMIISAKVGDDICDPGNNNLGCGYDGGDCCLPQAKAQDCIDPCGVRLKFYGGQNSEWQGVMGSGCFNYDVIFSGKCRKSPETENYCNDHYWYGPNKCDQKYCRYERWDVEISCN